MNNRHDEYRRAVRKAVEYQMSFQLPDGGYIWDGYAIDAFHKQALSWHLSGYDAEALRLLNWVKKNKLQPDGQLEKI